MNKDGRALIRLDEIKGMTPDVRQGVAEALDLDIDDFETMLEVRIDPFEFEGN